MKILLVEDEEHIAQGLMFNFEAEGYAADAVDSGEKALDHYAKGGYDLIVLDVMLPGMDGFDVARRIRMVDGRIPILMLTALSADADRIAGLECGVDDYLTKPFVLKELLLRIAALLRRSQWQPQDTEAEVFSFGNGKVDSNGLKIIVGDSEKQITRIEVDVMRHFASNPGRLISREELLKKVWDYEPNTATRTVDNFIMRVRKLVEPVPSKPVFLISIRGEGYRYRPAGKD